MGIGKSLADWTAVHLARFLATRLATPLMLTGTMALAAGGVVAITPTPAHQSLTVVVPIPPAPLFPAINCQPGRNGAPICRIPANQVALYAVAYSCHQNGNGDGLYVCPLMNK